MLMCNDLGTKQICSHILWIDPCLFDVDAFNLIMLKDNQNVGLGMQPGICSVSHENDDFMGLGRESKLFKHCAAGGDGSEPWTAEILEMMLTCIRYRRCLANICEKKKHLNICR